MKVCVTRLNMKRTLAAPLPARFSDPAFSLTGQIAAITPRPARLRMALAAVALAVLAARPTAGSALAFLKLFTGAGDASLARALLLGILHPADELVARKGGDVNPGGKRGRA